ncbi:MAG: Holliday junction resolvase RuvX [Candidatus Absconditabacterales bacterium]|nr:Holliday junction resolvase RuvX [Candidatus Absconditabacterales bacterium]
MEGGKRRFLGLDRGTSCIGRAHAWEDGLVLLGGCIDNDETAFPTIGSILVSGHYTDIVIGQPKEHNRLSRRFEKFVHDLQYLGSELTIHRVDETYSSVMARDILASYQKSIYDDAVSAMVILQRFFDHRPS